MSEPLEAAWASLKGENVEKFIPQLLGALGRFGSKAKGALGRGGAGAKATTQQTLAPHGVPKTVDPIRGQKAQRSSEWSRQKELGELHPDLPSSQGPVVMYHGKGVVPERRLQFEREGIKPVDTDVAQVGSGRLSQATGENVWHHEIPANVSVTPDVEVARSFAEQGRMAQRRRLQAAGLPMEDAEGVVYGVRAGALENAQPLNDPRRLSSRPWGGSEVVEHAMHPQEGSGGFRYISEQRPGPGGAFGDSTAISPEALVPMTPDEALEHSLGAPDVGEALFPKPLAPKFETHGPGKPYYDVKRENLDANPHPQFLPPEYTGQTLAHNPQHQAFENKITGQGVEARENWINTQTAQWQAQQQPVSAAQGTAMSGTPGNPPAPVTPQQPMPQQPQQPQTQQTTLDQPFQMSEPEDLAWRLLKQQTHIEDWMDDPNSLGTPDVPFFPPEERAQFSPGALSVAGPGAGGGYELMHGEKPIGRVTAGGRAVDLSSPDMLAESPQTGAFRIGEASINPEHRGKGLYQRLLTSILGARGGLESRGSRNRESQRSHEMLQEALDGMPGVVSRSRSDYPGLPPAPGFPVPDDFDWARYYHDLDKAARHDYRYRRPESPEGWGSLRPMMPGELPVRPAPSGGRGGGLYNLLNAQDDDTPQRTFHPPTGDMATYDSLSGYSGSVPWGEELPERTVPRRVMPRR